MENTDTFETGFIIKATNVPIEFFENREIAKKYFRKFGKVKLTSFKPKRMTILVEYTNEIGMQNALELAGEFNGKLFSVSKQTGSIIKKKKTKKEMDPNWEPDPEIREELAAMGGFFKSVKTYETRPKLMDVDSDESSLLSKTKPKWKSGSPKPKKKPSTTKEDMSNSNSNEGPLLNIMKQQAHSVEEKYRILDARDKLLRIRLKKSVQITKTKATVGTCPDMCPEKERLMRETQHQVALYEQKDGGREMNPKLAVKQYSRSSADQEAPLPQELRPVSVLEMTMGYLMHRIMGLIDTADVNVAEWYHFLWDRTRGIRKDITQQELCCPGSVALVEQCARFHIFCSARLVAEDPSVFDQKINTENLTKCLQTLKYMYHDLQLKNVSCENEPEFRAYIILLNLNDGNFMWEVQQLKRNIQQSNPVKFAIEVYSSLDKNNYVKFFKLVNSTTYLNACLLMRYFIQVRLSALKTLLKCYSPRVFQASLPLDHLTKILAFESIEATIEFVETYGLYTNEERTHVILNKHNFILPEFYVLDRAINLIESKRIQSVGEVVCGKQLPPKLYEQHQPQNSFNDRGYLIMDDIEEVEDVEPFERHQTPPPPPQQQPLPEPTVAFLPISTSSESDFTSTPTEFTFKPPEPTVNIFGAQKIEENRPKTTSLWSGSPTKPITNVFGAPINHKNIFGGEIVPLDEVDKVIGFPNLEEEKQEQKQEIPRTPSPDLEAIRRQQEEEEERERLHQLELEHERQRKLKEIEAEKLRKLEEERELEKMRLKLIAEQKKRQQQKQAELKAREIQNAVEQTMEDLLDCVEERIKTEKLEELREKVHKRQLLRVLRQWKEITRRKRKRKAIDFSPVWSGVRSVQEEANELILTNQAQILANIKRYKTGEPSEIPIRTVTKQLKLELPSLTHEVLSNRFMEINQKLQTELFWKITISLPDSSQFSGLNFIESSLDNFIKWKQIQSGTFLIEQSVKCSPTITYCLEKQKGVYNTNVSDSNGYIFFAKELNAELKKRIGLNLGNFGVFVKVPLVVVLENCSGAESYLDQLQNDDIITDFLIIQEQFTSKNIQDSVREGLVFLAERVEKPPPLELDTLYSFLTKHLCDIWKRIVSFSKWNANYKNCFKTPVSVIKIHNQAVNLLKSIILNKACKEYAKFPEIFRECLRSQIPDCLPCDYKYFPSFWDKPAYLQHIEKTMNSLVFPNFVENWPPRDELQLELSISRFCGQIFKQPEKPFYKVMSILLRNIDPTVNFHDIVETSWTDVIEMLATEKVNECEFSLYGTGFVNQSVFNQLIVVYDVETLNDYIRSDWFYVNHPIIRCEITAQLIEDNKKQYEPLKIIEIEDDCNIDELFDKTFNKSHKDVSTIKSDVEDCQNLLKDLEDALTVHRTILEKSGSFLKESLENANN